MAIEYDWQGAPIGGSWIEEEKSTPAPQQNYWSSWEPSNTWIGDGGFLIDAGQEQTTMNVAPAAQQAIAATKDYFTQYDQGTNQKYAELMDQEAEQKYQEGLKTGDWVGDNGYQFNVQGLPTAETNQQVETSGEEVIDNFKGLDENGRRIGFTSLDAKSSYMDPAAFQWYIDNGFVDDVEGAQKWLADNEGAKVIAKSDMQEQFGFKPFEENFGDRFLNTLNAGNNKLQNAMAQIADARSNQGYTAVKDDGTRVDVNDDYIKDLISRLEDRNQNGAYYILQTGEQIPISYLTENPIVDTWRKDGGYYFATSDGNEYYMGTSPDIQTRYDDTVEDMYGNKWTNDEIIKNFTDNRILDRVIDYSDVPLEQQADYLEEIKKNRGGKNADYGFMNWNKPKSAMGEDIGENLVNGNLIPQLADLVTGSAPYFSPISALPVGLGTAFSAAQGVDTMGKGFGNFDTVDNTAVAAPLQSLATIGEMALGGGMAGRMGAGAERGVFETIGDTLAPQLAEKVSHNAAGRIARDAVDEGLEEIATSPLYEAAASGLGGAYANDAVNERGFKTGEKEATAGGQRFQNWLSSTGNDFLGGALIGGPMAAVGETGNRLFSGSNKQADKEWKAAKAEGLDVPEVDDWLKKQKRG